VACVLEFNGRLPAKPGEYSPVAPWVRIDEGDSVITVSDSSILAMNPTEFEHLVTELLTRMGFRAQTTGQSGDGGVDCEAYDDRPVSRGKVIVQVKRYTHTVPPSMVRDLFGTVHATGAMKGVLVTTSTFGPESIRFAQDKPLELIDGKKLNELLRQFNLVSPAQGGGADVTNEPRAPMVSPDRRFYWDGADWRPLDGA
jgi:restriction system protein